MFEENNGNLLISLHKVFKIMDMRCYNAVKNYELTKNEAIILMFLSNNKNYDTAREIIKIRGLSKAHVCTSIDSLCKKGYLATHVDQNDRRIQHLTIQSSAEEIVKILNSERNSYLEAIFDGVNEQDLASFINMMKQIIKNTENLKEEK